MIIVNRKEMVKITNYSDAREIKTIKDVLTGKILYNSDPNDYKLLVKQYIEGTIEEIL